MSFYIFVNLSNLLIYSYKDMEYLREGILNILMFVPVGFVLLDIVKATYQCILIGACCSLSIEVLQFILEKGTFDLADLLHNTIGAALGVCFFQKTICRAQWDI